MAKKTKKVSVEVQVPESYTADDVKKLGKLVASQVGHQDTTMAKPTKSVAKGKVPVGLVRWQATHKKGMPQTIKPRKRYYNYL